MFRRALPLVLLALVASPTATAAQERSCPDAPEGYWAYEAVENQADKPCQAGEIVSEPAAAAQIEKVDAELRSIITRLSVEFKEEIAQAIQSEAIHGQRLDRLSDSFSRLEQQVEALRIQLAGRASVNDVSAYVLEIDALKAQAARQEKAIQRLYILCIVTAIAGLLIK